MRSSGVLMHISSLPSKCGIGTMGRCAYEFVDFLYESGQKCWQILPLCPTSFGNSPYQSPSVFAGNTSFIDLDFLVSEGILTDQSVREICVESGGRYVDFSQVHATRERLFDTIDERFDDNTAGYDEFCRENAFWLNDYALFMSAKEHYEGKCWSNFDNHLKYRENEADRKSVV